jgi:UDP:flavonoid glycosyltransferase YjiC (YdhE family)
MSRFLFASELGANMGHLGQLLPLASELQAKGHEIVFAVPDVTRAGASLSARGFRYVQAPLAKRRGAPDARPSRN